MKQIQLYTVTSNGTQRYYLGEHYPSIYLTQREVDIIKNLMWGTYADIAFRMGISKRTLESYMMAIRKKLDCRHKRDVIGFVIASGLLDSLIEVVR